MQRAITALLLMLGMAETAAAAEQSAGGLPQLNTQTFAPQLFWLAVTFTLLYLIMSRVALPRIGEVIEERKDRIQRDLAAAERLKAETEKALEAYEKALADARANASAIARETHESLAATVAKERAAVEEKLGKKLADAEARIAATKSASLASVSEIASGAVTAIVGQLIGQDVGKDELERVLKGM